MGRQLVESMTDKVRDADTGKTIRAGDVAFGQNLDEARKLVEEEKVVALDTGCVWGRSLSALRLDDRRVTQCDCGRMRETAPGQ